MAGSRYLVRTMGLMLAGAVLSLAGSPAAGQSSFFSATGNFAADSSNTDFYLNFAESSPIDTVFRTWAHNGGNNEAGDDIPPGGIDSYIEVYGPDGFIRGNDDAPGRLDSLLTPYALSTQSIYLPPLEMGTHRLRMEVSSTGVMFDGRWALDMTRDGMFRLDNVTGVLSTLGSLKFGSTELQGAVVRLSGQLSLSVLEVRDGGLLDVQGGTVRLGAASLTGSGRIDLHDNDMIVDYFDTSPIAAIKSYIASGYHNGTWTGDGITSSTAAAGGGYRLGYADNALLHLSTFSGQSVDDTTVLVKFTYGGDATLDGQVDISDLGALATAWQTSSVWTGGDFDYNGFVDISDLGILATNWQLGVGNPLVPGFDEALAKVGLPGATVPEPVGLFALPFAMLLYDRQRPRSSIVNR